MKKCKFCKKPIFKNLDKIINRNTNLFMKIPGIKINFLKEYVRKNFIGEEFCEKCYSLQYNKILDMVLFYK